MSHNFGDYLVVAVDARIELFYASVSRECMVMTMCLVSQYSKKLIRRRTSLRYTKAAKKIRKDIADTTAQGKKYGCSRK